eukprot:4343601-Alexandrium_andersonii.AAC.2
MILRPVFCVTSRTYFEHDGTTAESTCFRAPAKQQIVIVRSLVHVCSMCFCPVLMFHLAQLRVLFTYIQSDEAGVTPQVVTDGKSAVKVQAQAHANVTQGTDSEIVHKLAKIGSSGEHVGLGGGKKHKFDHAFKLLGYASKCLHGVLRTTNISLT